MDESLSFMDIEYDTNLMASLDDQALMMPDSQNVISPESLPDVLDEYFEQQPAQPAPSEVGYGTPFHINNHQAAPMQAMALQQPVDIAYGGNNVIQAFVAETNFNTQQQQHQQHQQQQGHQQPQHQQQHQNQHQQHQPGPLFRSPAADLPQNAAFGTAGYAATPGFSRGLFNESDQLPPDCHKMQLRVYFKHLPITANTDGNEVLIQDGGRHDLNNPAGFVIYRNRSSSRVSDSVFQFELPPEKPWMAKTLGVKDTKLTMDICKDIEKGLHVEYEDGCIFATRYCIMGVFYWTGELGDPQSVKLERNRKTPVFNFSNFTARMDKMTGDAVLKEKLPVIVFTFGQQWNSSSSSLKNMLVHAEVTPIAAVKKLQSLYAMLTGRRDHSIKSIPKTLDENGIQRSIDPPSANM